MKSADASCCDDGMPRPRPPHLHRETTRHGRTVWYVRVGRGPRLRLPCGPGQPGFDTAYRAALDGAPTAPKAGSDGPAGTLAWLVGQYRESSAWRDLSPATRKQREATLRRILTSAGKERAAAITRADIADGLEDRRDRPAAARHWLHTLRGLFTWAVKAQHLAADPTAGMSPPTAPRRKGEAEDGHPTWAAEDCAKFERKHKIGTRARVAYDVLRLTGLRRGDAVRLGRPHVSASGEIRIRTEKTGETVTLMMSPTLAATLAAGPTGDLTFIATERGRPLTAESFGNQFRDWCREAGVDKSAHGLRKLAATIAAENGATVNELEAMFGWSGGRMASLYTKAADRKRLGLGASAKMERMPPPAQTQEKLDDQKRRG